MLVSGRAFFRGHDFFCGGSKNVIFKAWVRSETEVMKEASSYEASKNTTYFDVFNDVILFGLLKDSFRSLTFNIDTGNYHVSLRELLIIFRYPVPPSIPLSSLCVLVRFSIWLVSINNRHYIWHYCGSFWIFNVRCELSRIHTTESAQLFCLFFFAYLTKSALPMARQWHFDRGELHKPILSFAEVRG